MNSYLQLLQKVPMFHGLSVADLTALEARLTPRTVKAGELLFAKDDIGTSMFVIVRGKVAVFLPPHLPGTAITVLQELTSGEFFGEMALLDHQPRMASVAATVDTDLIELSHNSLIEQLNDSPQIGTAMLAVMSNRLRVAAHLLGTSTARNVNKEADDNLTWAQRLADRVAHWNGSWYFIVILLLLTLIWVESNAIAALRFDPYPYQFFNLFLAILVAVQGPLIMMSQNRQMMKERIHAEADFQVNLKNESGIGRILHELEALREEVDALRGNAIPASPPISTGISVQAPSAAASQPPPSAL